MSEVGHQFWQAYLVNFLFWSALAQGSIAFVATLNITHARWGRRYTHFAACCLGFLPVCVVLVAVLLLGRHHIFPWVAEPVPEKAPYLNVPFLAAREVVGLVFLAFVSWKFLSTTRTTRERNEASPWAVILIIAFMVVYSYMAFDLVMSLQPTWYSTLLGAHYAVSSYFLGMAALCLMGWLRGGVPKEDRRKLSTLMFGFALFWISLLWSQYIVIWYGDMPAETLFVYLRFYRMPWSVVTMAVLALGFVFPFAVLMPRRSKVMGLVTLMASSSIVIGLFLERYVLVVPSLSPDTLSLGWIYLPVTAAFAGLFGLSYRLAAQRIKPHEQQRNPCEAE
ncbi:MAG: membrane protein [Candidatus Abyssubacteria bacterium]